MNENKVFLSNCLFVALYYRFFKKAIIYSIKVKDRDGFNVHYAFMMNGVLYHFNYCKFAQYKKFNNIKFLSKIIFFGRITEFPDYFLDKVDIKYVF